MGLFTAMFDIALLPVAITKDILKAPFKLCDYDDSDSDTRKLVEKIDEDIKGE